MVTYTCGNCSLRCQKDCSGRLSSHSIRFYFQIPRFKVFVIVNWKGKKKVINNNVYRQGSMLRPKTFLIIKLSVYRLWTATAVQSRTPHTSSSRSIQYHHDVLVINSRIIHVIHRYLPTTIFIVPCYDVCLPPHTVGIWIFYNYVVCCRHHHR